jgi:hypothetical protein
MELYLITLTNKMSFILRYKSLWKCRGFYFSTAEPKVSFTLLYKHKPKSNPIISFKQCKTTLEEVKEKDLPHFLLLLHPQEL